MAGIEHSVVRVAGVEPALLSELDFEADVIDGLLRQPAATMPITLPFITVSLWGLARSGGHASQIARVAIRRVLDEGV